MATDTKTLKTSVKKSSASGQLVTKLTMKAGLGLFKDKIVSESSAWEDDLRVTIKQEIFTGYAYHYLVANRFARLISLYQHDSSKS